VEVLTGNHSFPLSPQASLPKSSDSQLRDADVNRRGDSSGSSRINVAFRQRNPPNEKIDRTDKHPDIRRHSSSPASSWTLAQLVISPYSQDILRTRLLPVIAMTGKRATQPPNSCRQTCIAANPGCSSAMCLLPMRFMTSPQLAKIGTFIRRDSAARPRPRGKSSCLLPGQCHTALSTDCMIKNIRPQRQRTENRI